MTQTNNIPQGYKDSPLGIIPKEWEVKKIKEIAKLSSGGTPLREKKENWNGDIPWITTSLLNYPTIFDAEEYITEQGLQSSAAKLLPSGTLLMAMYGQGQTRGKVSKLMIEATTNQACAALTINKDQIDFIFYQLDYNYHNIRSYSNDGNQKNLSLDLIGQFLLILPPLPEQQKIAEILFIWDEAITKQTQLITQLETRKRGLMQQLLTGKKRVKGFSGKWGTVKLGDISIIKTGNKNNEDKVENGQFPFFVRSKIVEKINTYSYDGEAILIPGEGKIGETIHYINGKFDFHQRVYKISDFVDCFAKYIYYYLKIDFEKQAVNNSVKACVDSLRLPTFLNMKIHIPSIEEQTAIANILSAADTEIDLAKKKLASLKEQKKGLMQVLLTGKKRVKI